MELIEGAPLIDHITSLSEKRERFKEDRIWSIFTQVYIYIYNTSQCIPSFLYIVMYM